MDDDKKRTRQILEAMLSLKSGKTSNPKVTTALNYLHKVRNW